MFYHMGHMLMFSLVGFEFQTIDTIGPYSLALRAKYAEQHMLFVCVYMFICPELIEETGRFRKMIFPTFIIGPRAKPNKTVIYLSRGQRKSFVNGTL